MIATTSSLSKPNKSVLCHSWPPVDGLRPLFAKSEPVAMPRVEESETLWSGNGTTQCGSASLSDGWVVDSTSRRACGKDERPVGESPTHCGCYYCCGSGCCCFDSWGIGFCCVVVANWALSLTIHPAMRQYPPSKLYVATRQCVPQSNVVVRRLRVTREESPRHDGSRMEVSMTSDPWCGHNFVWSSECLPSKHAVVIQQCVPQNRLVVGIA